MEPGFRDQGVQNSHVAEPSLGDPCKGWNAAPDVQQRVHLHAGLGPAKAGPREHGQAQIDCRRIQGVDRLLPLIQLFEAQGLVDIKAASLHHESLSEVGIDAPVPLLVRVRKRTARDRGAETQVVEPVRHGGEAGFDVPQALPVGELSE
jgi:hypothetical protein